MCIYIYIYVYLFLYLFKYAYIYIYPTYDLMGFDRQEPEISRNVAISRLLNMDPQTSF